MILCLMHTAWMQSCVHGCVHVQAAVVTQVTLVVHTPCTIAHAPQHVARAHTSHSSSRARLIHVCTCSSRTSTFPASPPLTYTCQLAARGVPASPPLAHTNSVLRAPAPSDTHVPACRPWGSCLPSPPLAHTNTCTHTNKHYILLLRQVFLPPLQLPPLTHPRAGLPPKSGCSNHPSLAVAIYIHAYVIYRHIPYRRQLVAAPTPLTHVAAIKPSYKAQKLKAHTVLHKQQ